MTKQLTGPALVAYLRDNPTSDVMRAAADEIERLRDALQSIVDCCDEDHAARDYSSRQTEIRGIARAALAQEQGEPHGNQE